MYPSAELCRAQQAFQLSRAAAASLGNVRSIAEKAAAAWGVEAGVADDRERRYARRVQIREAHEQAELLLSENPDRGRADMMRGSVPVSEF
jgi:hypothetical protein